MVSAGFKTKLGAGCLLAGEHKKGYWQHVYLFHGLVCDLSAGVLV